MRWCSCGHLSAQLSSFCSSPQLGGGRKLCTFVHQSNACIPCAIYWWFFRLQRYRLWRRVRIHCGLFFYPCGPAVISRQVCGELRERALLDLPRITAYVRPSSLSPSCCTIRWNRGFSETRLLHILAQIGEGVM